VTSNLRPLLLVDDSADDLVFARRRLDKGGVRNPVLTFLSSQDAVAHMETLARTRQTPADLFPSVVFLDIRMPKFDGFDVLRWIRKEKAFAYVKVAMLSGSDEPRDKDLAAKLDAKKSGLSSCVAARAAARGRRARWPGTHAPASSRSRCG
jgi:CheY-like chemotaxis protein